MAVPGESPVLILTGAAGGYLTIVDGIIIPGWFFEPLRDRLRIAGHPVACAVLRAPLPLCLSRAGCRVTQPLADTQVVERLWQDFADLGPLERNVVDTGTRSPDETSGLLAERLGNGSLELSAHPPPTEVEWTE